jgi:hypothetical protein
MAQVKLILKVSIAWWWPYYVTGVVAAAYLTELQPREDRVKYWARKAIAVKPERIDGPR